MRFLRDTSFLSWAAILVVLGGVLLFAHALGSDPARAPRPGDGVGSVTSATRSQAAAVAEELRTLAPYGVAAGSDAATLTTWAEEVASTAKHGAQLRAADGAAASDPMYATFASINTAATKLAAASGDVVAARSLRTSVLLGIDRVASIAAGLPVPASVAGLGGGATTPEELLAPALPENGDAPAIPTPTPGAGHHHPDPVLDVDPPTAGDLTP